MKKHYLVGNWKMNGTKETWQTLARNVCQKLQGLQGLETVLCPPPPGLSDVSSVVESSSSIFLGAQSIHHQDSGAYTGGISAPMLSSLGVTHSLVGHSERRKLYVEEQGTVLRLQQCWRHGMTPMLCVGESAAQHEEGKAIHQLDVQLQDALYGVSVIEEGRLMVAYEPVWAISNGMTAAKQPTQQELKENFRFLRAFLVERFGDVGYTLPLVYGGSVSADNAQEIMQVDDIEGLMVGAASLDADRFASIAQAMMA